MWANSFASKEKKELQGANIERQEGGGSAPAAGECGQFEQQMQGYSQADDVAFCVALTFGK